jgi:ADP-ribose pyrophosphatase
LKTPTLISVRKSKLSAWAVLVERTYRIGADAEPQTFHSFRVADYATVLAITGDGRVPLVRQFRPALQRSTLELPGGLVERGEDAGIGALRELVEETGFSSPRPPVALPSLSPDTARLENRVHGFFLGDAEGPAPGWQPEPGVEPVVVSLTELRDAVLSGRLDHALHVAIIAQALLAGLLDFDR